jgi:Glycine cleavage system protein P (pyridoxal-binding), N-terminal domain
MQRREKTIDPNSFARRHIGPNEDEVRAMLREVGFESLDTLVEAAVPKNIRIRSRTEPAGTEIGDGSPG